VEESQYAGASERKVRMSWAPPGTVLVGEHYLLQMAIPCWRARESAEI
jgi:hypothetical protein